jgi:hypothetical protein
MEHQYDMIYSKRSENELTPGIFCMGKMNLSPRDMKKFEDHAKKYGISKFNLEENNIIKFHPFVHLNTTTMGWDYTQLSKALQSSDIFDTKITEVTDVNNVTYPSTFEEYVPSTPGGPPRKLKITTIYKPTKLYKHEYPNLSIVGLPTVYLHGSHILGYDVKNLPRYFLEYIYQVLRT